MKNPFKNENITDSTENITEEQNEEKEFDELDEIQETENSEADNSEIEKLKADYETLNGQYMRLAADFENFRKRQNAEREALLRYGTENALTKMIEVLENFERAEKALENIEDYEKYKESFELLHKQVLEALTKMGLESINAQGQEFDPNFHDAVMQTPTSEHPEHTVIAELQKGYKLGDKVLRPALVNVATAE
ncbi:nucleotide exchange factor GrpE [bacterium]|nr:nucleotide exchange factor GrpE [bacterium]